MMPQRDIKIRSARKWEGTNIIPADGDYSKSKNNVKGIIIDITSALDKCDIPFETYTFNILQKYGSSGPSKICGRQPLKNLKGYGLLKAVFHKFYLVHS